MSYIKRKIHWKRIFFLVAFLAFFGLFLSGIIHIIVWFWDQKHIDVLSNEIYDLVEIEEISPSDDTNFDSTDHSSESSIQQKLIDVPLEQLKQMNADTVGWIMVNGTKINYPFVQTNNNDFYLNHSFDRKKNGAGWIFMDYRNDFSEVQKNIILYAHGGSNQALFGSLKHIFTKEWLENESNFFIKLSTLEENSLWQIFSIYEIPTTSDYLQVFFANDEDFSHFLSNLASRSRFDFSVSLDSTDQILTLSTCSNNDNKIVLHAKKISSDQK